MEIRMYDMQSIIQTHGGLVMPYGGRDVGQQRFR